MGWLWGDGERGKVQVEEAPGAGFQILFTLLLALVLVNHGHAAEDTDPAADAHSAVEEDAAEAEFSWRGQCGT